MINRDQFATLIADTLQAINLYSEDAVFLLLGTAAQESKFGHYLTQLGGGPGRGFFQIEPGTERDNWENYLRYRPTLARKVVTVSGLLRPTSLGQRWLVQLGLNRANLSNVYDRINPNALGNNLVYDICMARIKYRRAPGRLPSRNDLPALAAYWKEYYNTVDGAGTVADFIVNYRKYIKLG